MGKMRKVQLVVLVIFLCGGLVPNLHAQSDRVRILLEAQNGQTWDDDTLSQTVVIIRNRLEGLDLADVIVQRQGDSRISVEVSREAVNAALLEALLRPGLLEFVDFSTVSAGAIENGACILTTEQVRLAEARLPEGETPRAYTAYTCADGTPALLKADGQPFQTVMLGAGIADAAAEANEQIGNDYVVYFVLKSGAEDADSFIDYVANHPNTALAIVLDGRLLSAPVIQAGLSESARAGTMDSGYIAGNFSRDEARLLAAQIKYGAFPLLLQIVSVAG
ncbi:MAG: hypothetical protein JXQ72_13570 [Anaerolineae bacterium]|nr:hypothetical protein [Anaerolineae bacterium]